MFILRRALILSRYAVNKDLPSPKIYQLHTRLYTTEKNQSNKIMDSKREVSYEDILKVVDDPKKIIIDVREPNEIDSTGKIPSSINIPLDTVKNTLQMSDNEFRTMYNREKPKANDEIIFYCKSGRRASQATEQAVNLGYNKSKTYLGSWEEWSSKRK